MVQRTVLKVDISCLKCKKQLLKAVSKLQGVDKIEIDAAKGTLTVTGDADPYEIIVGTRKAGKNVEVVSIGPPPAPQKQEAQKKPDQKKEAEKKKPEETKPEYKAAHFDHNPYTCPVCQLMAHSPYPHQVGRYEEPNSSCSIM
ncbi:heavy metal-associated isoprenylated plant protein 2-like [Tripterygium wilfordii]|nr:heavy metal-associated isoprenylated plant protein 2-like [Tripterygium wilfordii]